jgi:hypothetical protein
MDSSNRDSLDAWRADPGHPTWKRFRGRGERGAPSCADLDGQDLALAIKELETGRTMLVAALGLPSKSRGRRAGIDEALGKIALATRWADEVVERRGGRPGDCEG